MNRISNLNSIQIKSYGETLALLKQLDKMGLIKSKSKSKKKPKMIEDIKQESDMVASVKTLEGERNKGTPNLFALRQIEPGMTQQQIRDITERNNAGVATLRAEIQQQRLEDFQGAFEPLTRLANLASERFRGAQEPGAGQRPNPFVQSTTIEEIEPDIQEETFTQSLNEGGPRAQPQVQTELFAEGEEAGARLGPQERLEIGYGMSPEAAETLGLSPEFIDKTRKATKKKLVRDPQDAAETLGLSPEFIDNTRKATKKQLVRDPRDAADELGLGKIPTMRNSYNAIEEYYIALTDKDEIEEGRDPRADSKSLMLADIDRILKGYFG
jgi:hypothetical protein